MLLPLREAQYGESLQLVLGATDGVGQQMGSNHPCFNNCFHNFESFLLR